MVIISYKGEWYDVTEFSHPGDGIKGIDLKDFDGKVIDIEFDREHMTDEPFEMLLEAKRLGLGLTSYQGIKYLGATHPTQNKKN